MFRFRLQRVLEIRERTEQEAAGKLAEAREHAAAASQACEALEAMQADSRVRLAAFPGNARSVGELQRAGLLLDQLGQQVAAAREALGAAEARVEQSLSEYTAAFQDRRVLDKLRERHLESWRGAEVQGDRVAMDGIALTQFGRRAASGLLTGS